jgi:glycosyltransferase involved in cell wall biosynthesis
MNAGGNDAFLEVIIPVKDRFEVLQCVESLARFSALVAKILVCDGGSTDAQCLEALKKLQRHHNVEVLQFQTPGFNKSILINKGIERARSEFTVISDTDILWSEAALKALLNKVRSDANTICYVGEVEESIPSSVARKRDRYTYKVRVTEQVAFIDIVSDGTCLHRPGCGLICARKSTLIALGGYKEIFSGWGWEDQDLLIRASLFGIQVRADGGVTHLSHSDKTRNRHHDNVSPSFTRNRNIIACLKSLSEGVFKGNLQLDEVSQPQLKQIHFRLPSSLVEACLKDNLLEIAELVKMSDEL